MKKVLSQKFFDRDTRTVAKELLGKYLVRKIGKKEITVMITETEAYDGFSDKASHAHRGKTMRNEIMFGPAGYWYVYFTYGMHWMLNVVTGPKDYPAAVLIRGAIIESNYKSGQRDDRPDNQIIHGPARLTKFLKIDTIQNMLPAVKSSGLWIEDRSTSLTTSRFIIKSSPRIGVDYSGPIWSKKYYRFYLETRVS